MSEHDRNALPQVEPFRPGMLVGDKYRVERLIGHGGMGYVFLATDVQLERQVTLKFMKSSLAAGSRAAAARFVREARAAANIRSAYVARVTDAGTLEGGTPYMVAEYLDGQHLESLLRERQSLPVSVAVDIALQVCEGLAEAHGAGIVHRDLKPSNIFLARQTDGSMQVKLLEVGISKLRSDETESEDTDAPSSGPYGSPLYMAPEQMRSTSIAEPTVDIWAVGVALYEMLAAVPPFVGNTVAEICRRVLDVPPPSLRALRPEVPERVEAAVMQCLEKDPRSRFQNVAAVARAIAPFGGPSAAAAVTRIESILNGGKAGSADARSDARAPSPVPSDPQQGQNEATPPAIATGPMRTARSFRTLFFGKGRTAKLVLITAALVLVTSGLITRTAPTEKPRRSAAGSANTTTPAVAPSTRLTSDPVQDERETDPTPLPYGSSPVISVPPPAVVTRSHRNSMPAGALDVARHSDRSPAGGAGAVRRKDTAPVGTTGFGGRN